MRSFTLVRCSGDERAGFRFRYRKVWGFKSLLVHYEALFSAWPAPGFEHREQLVTNPQSGVVKPTT
jgi:hypothetical protein